MQKVIYTSVTVEQPSPVTHGAEMVGIPTKTSQFWLILPPFLPPSPPPLSFPARVKTHCAMRRYLCSLCLLLALCPFLSHEVAKLKP